MHPNEVDTADAPNWLYRPSFPDAWPKAKLSSLAQWINGMAFKDFQFSASGRPIIKIAEIKNGIAGQTKFTLAEYDKVYLIHKGDLLFSWSGQPETSIDAFWWPGPDGWLNQHVFKVVPNQALVSQDFLYYLLKYLNPNFVAIARNKQTTGLGHVTKADIAAMEVGIPPPEEQKAIVDQIWSIDRKIDLNRQINQTLEQMAQALFQSWFVDFEPVKAKVAALADGRDPLRAAMSTLSGKTDAELDELPGAAFDTLAATAALFPEEMEESGERPKGWEVSTIGQEVSVLGGGTPSTANAAYWNGEFAWVTPRDLSRLADKVLTMTERKITKAGVQNISSGQLPVGTVLLSSRAPIGYLALTTIPVSINQGFIAMICRGRLPNMYVLQWAAQNLDAIKQRGSGTTFAEISKGNFRPMPVLVPDEKALAAYQESTLPLYEQITTNLRETDTLATLRDSLLPKLLSGELAVTPEEAPT